MQELRTSEKKKKKEREAYRILVDLQECVLLNAVSTTHPLSQISAIFS